ncbi:dual specificity protein phosphatase 14-like [Lineus longissimus]|uniref:dual specificity protein phosphatase 14-like n=1 Tax=Lineus longissimus TaxID=88925 RepID=UPI00315C6CDA
MYQGAFGQIAQINDHLFLCGVMARKMDRLRQLGITSVINCTIEIANIKCHDIECVQIQVDDLPTASLGPYFDRCADKIHQVRRRGGKTLVHCVAGVSRSASLVMAYLMKYQGMNLREAYYYTKARRSVIRPNVGFWKQLIDFEKRLHGGASTVKMVSSPIGFIPDVYKDETRNMMYGHGVHAGHSTFNLLR